MKREINSSRSIRWIKRNSLNYKSCEEYVLSLCKSVFNFKEYTINEYEEDEKALWLTYGLYSYIIFVSCDDINLKVLEKNKLKKNKDNYYHEIRAFNGDSCWINCLNWIKNRG